jgi:phage anti-repressor protein
MNNITIIEHKELKRAVSARELYEFLEIKEDFTNWFKRMVEYGFENITDYIIYAENSVNSENRRGRPSVDYLMTIEMAKEISMLQRTEKGKQARKYFIECERQLKEQQLAVPNFSNPVEAALAWIEEYKAKQLAIEERDIAIKTKSQINNKITATAMARASVETRRANKLADELGIGKKFKQVRAIEWLSDYFDISIVSFYSQFGKALNKFSKDNGFEVKIIDDSKYGKINNYHINAIEGFKKYLDNNPCALPKYRFA